MSVISLQMIPCLPMATMELESPRSPNFHQCLSRVETSSSLSNFPTERPSDIEKAFVCNWVFATQGGLMMRGVVQRCPQPPMRFVQLTRDKGPWHCFYPLHRNLVTFGSPHQGVFGIPECEAEVPAAPDVFLALKYFHSRWEIPFCVSWRASWSRLVHTSLGSRFAIPAKLFPIFLLNRTLWPRRSIGMTPSIRPTSWY